MMNQSEAIKVLKKEVETNKALDAVLHVWALRKRARNTVTVGALKQRMKLEGFEFSPSEYAQVLKFLAQTGFGTLEADKRGQVLALKDVKITLQSIGQAVCGGTKEPLHRFKARQRFQSLPPVLASKAHKENRRKSDNLEPHIMGLTMNINGKALTISVPKEFDEQDVAGLISKLRHIKSA